MGEKYFHDSANLIFRRYISLDTAPYVSRKTVHIQPCLVQDQADFGHVPNLLKGINVDQPHRSCSLLFGQYNIVEVQIRIAGRDPGYDFPDDVERGNQ